MKSVLKWSSLPFAILAVTVAVYILVSAIGMFPTDADKANFMPDNSVDAMALLIASSVFIGSGPVSLSIGAFRRNRTLPIIGAVVFVFGVILFFVSLTININHINRLMS